MRPAVAIGLLVFCSVACLADRVITKDGKVYSGKIMIESDKSVLIGNPPYDPNSTLIKSEDIETIVYEQYHPNAPAVRRRGFTLDFDFIGNAYSSKELSLRPSGTLGIGGGFRFHPLIEIGAALQWTPALTTSGDPLTITDGTVTRGYSDFWMYTLNFVSKIYPFFKKTKWATEPYLLAGFGWDHLIPKQSGDSLSGSGWLVGFGAIRPVTEHLFLNGNFFYQSLGFDTVRFLGRDGAIDPQINEHQYSLTLGLSYRI
jgi:hypothetical protein